MTRYDLNKITKTDLREIDALLLDYLTRINTEIDNYTWNNDAYLTLLKQRQDRIMILHCKMTDEL